MLGPHARYLMSPIEISGQAWWTATGEGSLTERGFLMTQPGRRAETLGVAQLPVPLSNEDFGFLEVAFSQTGGVHSLSLGVGQDEETVRPETVAVEWVEAGVARITGKQLRLGEGEVQYVFVRALGGLGSGLCIESAKVHRAKPSFLELQGLLVGSLIDLSGWTQRSINHSLPDRTPLRLSPVLAVVAWIMLTTLLTFAWMAWHGELERRSALLGLVLAFSLGWLLLDLGWQVSLWQRHFAAVVQYSGLSTSEKRLTEVDGDTFAFIEDLKAKLANPQRRLVIFGDAEFSHYRARYFSVPQPVASRENVDGGWLRRLRQGDVMALIGLRDSVQQQAVQLQDPGERSVREFELSNIMGRHAGVFPCDRALDGVPCRNGLLQLKSGEQPWLVEVPWMSDLEPGVWRSRLELLGGDQGGWVRLEVFRRQERESAERWAWHEIFVPEDERRTITLAFRADNGARYRARLRELNARGVSVLSARLVPWDVGDGLVELSLDGSPPYFLARRLLEQEGHAALVIL
jgi:hypothetical protein